MLVTCSKFSILSRAKNLNYTKVYGVSNSIICLTGYSIFIYEWITDSTPPIIRVVLLFRKARPLTLKYNIRSTKCKWNLLMGPSYSQDFCHATLSTKIDSSEMCICIISVRYVQTKWEHIYIIRSREVFLNIQWNCKWVDMSIHWRPINTKLNRNNCNTKKGISLTVAAECFFESICMNHDRKRGNQIHMIATS